MENSGLKPISVLEGEEEAQLTPAEKVFTFLSEDNFFTPGEGPVIAVDRFLTFIKRKDIKVTYFPRDAADILKPATLNSFVDVLQRAGYAKPGELSREEFDDKTKEILFRALVEFQTLSPEKKEDFKKYLIKEGKHLMV